MELIEQKELTCEEDGAQQTAESAAVVPQLSSATEKPKKEAAAESPKTALEAEPSLEPEEKTVDNGETLSKIEETASRLSEQVEALTQLFLKRILYTDHEEKMVDQMHRELQQYKADLYARLVQPILLDIIEIRDSIIRVGTVYRSKPDGEQDIPNKTFSDYAYDLQDILEKNNVEIYRCESGDAFAPIRQRAIKKVATPEKVLHGKVAESLCCGYRYNGRTISAEKVSVYYYEKPAETAEPIETSEVNDNG